MNARTIAVLMMSAVAVTATAGEVYRLKYAATVDVLDESGKVVGKKKLKPKTLLVDAPKEEPAPAPGSFLAPELYKIEQTPHTLMKADVSINSFYGVPMEGREKDYWSLRLFAFGKNWDGGTSFYGFVKKDTKAGKFIYENLKDGSRKEMELTVSPLPKELYKYKAEDYVIIEAAELRKTEGQN